MRFARLIVLILLIPGIFAPAAHAQVGDCGPDCLELYFTLLHSGTSCLPGSPVGFTTAYLTLSSPTFDAISYMSFAVVVEGPVVVTGVDFGGAQICEPIEPGAVCHVWDPALSTGSYVELAAIGLQYFGTGEPAFVGVRTEGLTMDDPVWVSLPDGSETALNRSTGPGHYLCQLGGECQIVPAEARSWGTLKSLYR